MWTCRPLLERFQNSKGMKGAFMPKNLPSSVREAHRRENSKWGNALASLWRCGKCAFATRARKRLSPGRLFMLCLSKRQPKTITGNGKNDQQATDQL